MAESITGEKRFVVRFKYSSEKEMILNKLNATTVERIPDVKEAEVSMVFMIADETVDLDKGYYYSVYALLKFKK